MFYGGNVYKKIKHLSGGERIRLVLSRLLFEDVNLLILDEPTNHLDTVSIESIEEALENFKGTIFFISHDRYFINKIANRVVAVEDHRFQSYLGNYDYYKSELDKISLKNMNAVLPKPGLDRVAFHAKINNQNAEAKKKEARAVKAENRIKEIEDEINRLEAMMETEADNYEGLNSLFQRKEELNKSLDEAMEEWMTLNS
jgi:ABC-type multidrug transport system ATPase subunit